MPVPFERARTLLIYGTMLRRVKRRKAAREAIEAALSIFEGLPAPVWVENARAELARVGGRAPSGGGLTEGERRVAELVAAGRSNKETAAALSVSVHTVEDALKRVYRKLGVRSRTELSRRLNADADSKGRNGVPPSVAPPAVKRGRARPRARRSDAGRGSRPGRLGKAPPSALQLVGDIDLRSE